MIGEDRDRDAKFRLRLHGFEVPEEPTRLPGSFEPDLLAESPLWQQHKRMLSRDAKLRRN